MIARVRTGEFRRCRVVRIGHGQNSIGAVGKGDARHGGGYYGETDLYDSSWTFTIQKADPLSFASQAVSITFGDTIDNELTNLSGAAVTYTSSNPAVASFTGGSLVING